jgi:hypothetical protein
VKRVVIANPLQVRIIAHAKIKTDTIDTAVLASGFLPEVWIPDEATQAHRRQVTRRDQMVRQRTRLKNLIQSLLHAHLIPACPATGLCGSKGTAGLSKQVLPKDERLAIERPLREFDRLGEDLAVIECNLARSALVDENDCTIDGDSWCRHDPAGNHLPDQRQRSATARRACRAMRMADAPDASDGISDRRASSFRHSIFPWSKVAFRDVGLPPDPFDLSDLSEASDLSPPPPLDIQYFRGVRSPFASWDCRPTCPTCPKRPFPGPAADVTN